MNSKKCDRDHICLTGGCKSIIVQSMSGKNYVLCLNPDREIQKNCKFSDRYGGAPENPHGYYCLCTERKRLIKEQDETKNNETRRSKIV